MPTTRENPILPANVSSKPDCSALELDRYEWGIANSAGILGWPDTHRLWARAGIALYGADPMSDRKSAQRDLRPVMTMKSTVLAVNRHTRGDLIGYGGTYTCPRDMTIAVIAAGYADGYPRHKVDSARVSIHGRSCEVVGRVSMDMITVDASAIEDLDVGHEVTLFGADPAVNDLADCSERSPTRCSATSAATYAANTSADGSADQFEGVFSCFPSRQFDAGDWQSHV